MDSINNIIKRLRENRILQERADYSKYSRNELIKLAKDGDQLAVDTLIKSHQGFIKNMSSKYFLSTGDKDDVEQVATIAFWTAIQDWDMTGDFEAFAGRRIKSRLSDEISKESAGKSQINTLANSIDDTINSDGEGGLQQTLQGGRHRQRAGFGPERTDFLLVPMQREARQAFYLENLGLLRTFTAVFVVSDVYAAELLRFLTGQGIAVPGDINLAGFDDTPLCTLLSPTLTTVRQARF